MNDRRLDDLIDAALPEYSRVEPPDGLEERIMRRIRAAPAWHSPWRRRLAFAIPAFAALVLAGVAMRPVDLPPPDVAALKPPPPAPVLPPPLRKPRPAARAGAKRALPKQERFPAPAPLTAEERALAAWIARAPREAAQVFADLRQRSGEPVSVEPIRIEPLQNE